MDAIQLNREARVSSALPDDVLLFAGMSGEEGLGRLSAFTVHLLSSDGAVRVADVLGKPMTVTLATDEEGGLRYFNGIVTRFRSTGWQGEFASYEATLHPWLWLLTRSADCRIFQDLAVPDIVKQVCQAYGGVVSLSASALGGEYPPLAYCVQYRETDFDFVCRLLEGAGIYFYFTHEADKHTMVLADSYAAHLSIPGYGGLKFGHAVRAGAWSEESVSSWTVGGEIASSKVVLNDFDFEKASNCLSGGLLASANVAAGFEQAPYEVFDYPGNYSAAGAGNALARARIERLHGQCEQAVALTDARGLYPGGMFTLADHPRDDQNREYLVTSARYEVTGNDYASGAGGFAFRCRIGAIGKEHPYRPPASVARPVVQGPQTAIVVGKAGEEIWTDQYGRIKVQFHWDRQGKGDENSSCWVRVAQGWAGKGWGAMALPRIGMEVIVSFLEGDPDRPLVTGCLYNSDAMPPYALPASQTRSTVKSRSSKGGDGFNELRFEDKKGGEEVFMHAERDFLRVVKHDDALEVGHDQSVAIDGKQEVKVGSTIVVEAGTSIELRVGASSIKIEAAKITIKAPEIEIAADANAKLHAGALVTIDGALVQIN
ncbi:type VI secretion system tip protein TssI/VgrG [Massilia sp. ZL223]|uniref:type VI secretion system Vgr family protein n=1 Tax=Massilia sp. ZL223 TaxID=2824904 RepID=UPI001B821ED0|nr:type VI secretion system tip protein TssI/VgrG [Massilia sp. ZL223]MBQ5965085.1 type VI secretion system tip protein VgrG [Massilia sp. ZL223]